MPDSLRYDEEAQRLWVGEKGYVDRVPKAVWLYEVSGKQVLKQWFSYRKADRKRPLIGDKRKPSDLDKVHPSGWLPEYTKELLNVLHVLGRLVRLEAKQAALLARVCAGEQISAAQLVAAPKTALEALKKGRTKRVPKQAKKLSLPFSLDDEGA